MQRISKLPQEKQAEAIGNIAGRVISLLIPVKAGMMIDTKISKISRQTTR